MTPSSVGSNVLGFAATITLSTTIHKKIYQALLRTMKSPALEIVVAIIGIALSHPTSGTGVETSANVAEPTILAAATYVMDNLFEQDYDFLNLLTNDNKEVYIPRIIQSFYPQSSSTSNNDDPESNEYHVLTIMVVEQDETIETCVGSFDVTVSAVVNNDNAGENEWSIVEWGKEHKCDDFVKDNGGDGSAVPLTPSRPLAGGFAAVDDIQNPELLEAVEFVMLQIQDVDVTNVREYDFYPLPLEDNYDVRIIDAFDKVVAGKLLKISFAIESSSSNNDECVGALQVTVFDSFGTLSIQSWGPELTCDGYLKYPEEQEQNGLQQGGNDGSQTNNREDTSIQDATGSSASTRSTKLVRTWLFLISIVLRLI